MDFNGNLDFSTDMYDPGNKSYTEDMKAHRRHIIFLQIAFILGIFNIRKHFVHSGIVFSQYTTFFYVVIEL